MAEKEGSWFASWFNSKYYHILYQHRNDAEAAAFLEELIRFLNPVAQSRFWDMACGKGRHSVYINKKGFDVTGTDLSEESILYAKQFENEKLRFYKHDMRTPFVSNYFDYVLNLFTSFGYFDVQRDEQKVFDVVYTSLKPSGRFVLDYLNAEKIVKVMKEYEEKELSGILFRISKKVENGFIVKRIQFSSEGKEHDYTEKVKIFGLNDFKQLGQKGNFKFLDVYGDYSLSNFTAEKSDRMIVVFEKKKT
jgi:SAM-dependent methyltransferase